MTRKARGTWRKRSGDEWASTEQRPSETRCPDRTSERGELVHVRSANLTEAAFDRNIELGLLVRDGALAASVTRHFQVLIDRRLLVPLPAA
jgi:hypothetical protein